MFDFVIHHKIEMPPPDPLWLAMGVLLLVALALIVRRK